MNELFVDIADHLNTPKEEEKIAAVYSVCENISLDYGIMEKAGNVNVVLSDFGWSDLGTWGSLFTHFNKDKDNNAIVGRRVVVYDSTDNMINVPKNKLTVVSGLDDFILVDTGDVLMICPKQDEQKIKQIVNDLKISKYCDYV